MIKQYAARLPFEYQEVEYIENYISEYIDTGLTGADMIDCEIEICMQVLISNANEFMLQGAYESGHTAQIGLVTVDENTVRCSMNLAFAEAVMVSGFSKADFHTLYLTSGLQKVDGVQVGTSQTVATLTTNQFLIFGRYNQVGSSSITISKMTRIKYFWVKKNDEYLRYFIPCYRKADNEVGMYDIANDVFYTNIGGGAFVKGPNVNITHWNEIMYRQYGVNETLSPIPSTVFSQGDGIDSCTVYGNTVQNGTPTPSSIVDINGVGDQEIGYVNEVYDWNKYTLSLSSGPLVEAFKQLRADVTYTISWEFQSNATHYFKSIMRWYSNGSMLFELHNGSHLRLSQSDIETINASGQLNLYYGQDNTDGYFKDFVFDSGLYKIPINVDSQIANIYLGTTQSTRRIQKLVLTGEENWSENASGTNTFRGMMNLTFDDIWQGGGYCTHLIYKKGGISIDEEGCSCVENRLFLRFLKTLTPNINDFKQYLQQQYQAGTPVTVYYVLAEPQTTMLNQPLMKIGDYADSVTYDSNIPTTYGQNDITTDTQIKPSKLDITYNALRRAKVYKNDRWILNPSIDWSQTLKISDLQSKKIKEMEGEYIGYNIHT